MTRFVTQLKPLINLNDYRASEHAQGREDPREKKATTHAYNWHTADRYWRDFLFFFPRTLQMCSELTFELHANYKQKRI